MDTECGGLRDSAAMSQNASGRSLPVKLGP